MSNLSGITLGIFLLIAVGAGLKRFGLLRYEDRHPLNNIIIFVTLPALIFTAAHQARFSSQLIMVAVLSLALGLVMMTVGYVAAKALRLKGPTFGAFILACSIGNTGYLGYPLAQSIFGEEHLVKAVFFDIFGTVLLLFTVGIFVAAKYGRAGDNPMRQGGTLAAPNLVALGLGFATHGLIVPVPIDLALTTLAKSTTGIIMLSIGISLSGRLRQAKIPVIAVAALKIGLMPALALAAGVALNLPPVPRGITLLQASMPTALMCFVIGDRHDLDRDLLSGAILASTVLSVLTIPGWQSLAAFLHL